MEALEPSLKGPQPSPDGPVVLLVDDDIALRTAMRDFLAASGCRVLEARNSYDGLFLAAQYGSAIQLLVTEINLLPVSGIKLAENVLRLHPLTQVLVISDCEETRPIRHWMRYLNAAYLRKPFTPADLHGKVQAMLGAPWDEVPMSVLEAPLDSGARGYSSNSGDPDFWLRDF